MSSKIKILYIEDDEGSQFIVNMLLNNSKYAFYSATDGKAGFQKALSLKPDLILLDIQLPEINGFELVKKIRKNRSLKTIPIIIITAEYNIEIGINLKKYNCQGYIEKPIDTINFEYKICEYLKENKIAHSKI